MNPADWRAALDASEELTLKTVAQGDIVVTHATGARMVAAWTLVPAPPDPAQHLETAHAAARPYLARLASHDPGREVASVMTEELFDRLTDPQATPLTAPAGARRYTYTPRKVLRRVLDHSLDHLNQIDQWLTWRRDGIVPTPTDGWVPSTVTVPDDRLPLSPSDLDAWLWRVDQAARLLVQRAAALTSEELDWQPPDGGWPLRRVLHHVARSEMLYSASLDDALPSEDARVRYAEACRRLGAAVSATSRRGADEVAVYPGLYGMLRTPDQVIADVLAIESELVAGAV